MTPGRKRDEDPRDPRDAEGWESLAEEASEGRLSPSAELEAALAEAAASVPDERERRKAAESRGEQERERAETLERELAETRDQLLRLRADFDNFRKRALREHQEAYHYGHQNLVKDLLPSVDNLDRAIDHARTSGSGDLEQLLQGVELVRRELLAALGQHGVSEIEAERKPFDPAVHEAMGQRPDASVAPNTVVEVLQKGFLLRDRLLRPSRVIVARAPDEEGGGG